MRSTKFTTAVLLACLVVIWVGYLHADDLSKSVNAFYKKLVGTLKGDKPSAKAVTALVEQDRTVAEKCLTLITQKCDGPGELKDGYSLLKERLSEGLLLSTPGKDCSSRVISPLIDAVDRQSANEDKVFIIQTISRLCPEKGDAYYPRLGDLFFSEGQFGMAVEAYQKALQKNDDEGVRQALVEAQRRVTSYQEAKALSRGDFEKLAKEKRMGLLPGFIRKVKPPSSVQTNRILFDEWSYAIKDNFVPELKGAGEALESELTKNRYLSVSIDGHTDNRGPYEKNMALSKQRAEAIKKYLTDNFRIDPNRVVTKGYGPEKPFSPKSDSQGLAENRRVEFKISE